MHSAIIVKHESPRLCGKRKKGGLYLVSDNVAQGCGKMPVPLEVCPCCGGGIKPSRAPVWIKDPESLWFNMACTAHTLCKTCPVADDAQMGPALLIWVGEKFYAKPADFIKESAFQGLSRRIKAVPQGFVVGQTWVLLAHRKAIELPLTVFSDPKASFQAGIFRIFRPSRIEVIVDGTESDETIEGYLERGLTPVLPVYKPTPQADSSEDADSHWTALL